MRANDLRHYHTGGVDAFLAKAQSDAHTSVTYGRNGTVSVKPKLDYSSGAGEVDARFVGNRRESRLGQRITLRDASMRDTGKRAFGGGVLPS